MCLTEPTAARYRTRRPAGRRVLYLAAVGSVRHNPILGGFYRRLRAAGKPAKVAPTAVMRKPAVHLNRVLRKPARAGSGPASDPNPGPPATPKPNKP